MRSFIMIFFLALAGCGGSTDNDSSFATQQQVNQAITAVPNESTSIAALRAEVNSLQTSIKQLQLIGRPIGTSVASSSIRDFRMLTEPTLAPNAVTIPGQFGPCTNMGVTIGFTNANGQVANALSAVSRDFQQCNGYEYSVNVSDGSIANAERIFWDGPNCTGNLIEWEAGGAGYNTTTLKNGVVFTSPVDRLVYMVKSGQTPQPILIQSVWVLSNPGCQSDIETQLMYKVTPNDVTISGVPNNGVGSFQLGAP